MSEVIQIRLREPGEHILAGPALRFAVFSCEHYYPSGGWYDLYAFTNDQQTALELAAEQRESAYSDAHVVDLQTGEVIDDGGTR